MRNSRALARGVAISILLFTFHSQAQIDGFELLDPKPLRGSFYSLQKFLNGILLPPLPYNPFPDAAIYACVTCEGHRNWYYYDDREVEYQPLTQSQITQSYESSGGEGEGGWQAAYSYPTGSLYLEITGLSSNLDNAYLLVHGTRAGEVYELKSTVLLTNHVLTAWNTEQSIHGLEDITPATVSLFDRTNTLFFWARLWTTNDVNANAIPDWWEWENFGNLSQQTNADFDSDGINNLQEYQAITDPNTISFLITFANQNVSFSAAPLHLSILGGIPSSMAALVDSTNFAAANWRAFNMNPTVNLGSTEGWHEVWIGLRGRKTDSQQTWRKTRLKLDITPPLLVLTNPSSATVSIPTIQLQGYSAEPLASFTYDLTNASGLVTNQLVLVTDQAYTTNTWECTTNYFQAFDVMLTNGANTITFRATDLAGNTRTTNITFNLDYAGKTNPPSLKLQWPQNGAHLAGDSFTWRGRLDDQTVQITAQYVDSFGVTNSIGGAIRRDGQFRIQNLPLTTGTNLFKLVATGAAGNQTTTNVSVIKSILSLTINSLSWFDASGTINDSNYKVWVNGKPATLNGTSGWSSGAHLTLSNPTLQVRAIPNSDNGGDGSGGGSAAMADDEGNPASSGAVDCEADMSWPDDLIQATAQYYLWDEFGRDATNDLTGRLTDLINWSEAAGGTEQILEAQTNSYATNIYWDGSVSFPGEELPQVPDGLFTSFLDGSTNGWGPPFAVWHQGATHAEVDYSGNNRTWTWREDEQLTLVTADSGESEVYTISGGGTYLVFPDPRYPGYRYGSWSNLPPEQISIGSFGNLDTNGNLMVILPPRTTLDITPRCDGGASGGAGPGGSAAPANTGTTGLGVSVQRDYWKSETKANIPIDKSRTILGVGEEVWLYWNPPPPAQPTYSVSAGSVRRYTADGWTWLFTAPSNKATVTVTCNFPKNKLYPNGAIRTRVFEVVEPTGVDNATVRIASTTGQSISTNVAGAWMRLDVPLSPTNVSFYRVMVWEEGKDASDVTGYFTDTNHPAISHIDHRANEWHQVDKDNFNLIHTAAGFDTCSLFGSTLLPKTWSAGSFTWDIPAKWKIDGGPTNNLNGWHQDFSLTGDGTVTITKFGKSVTRTTNNVITTPNL